MRPALVLILSAAALTFAGVIFHKPRTKSSQTSSIDLAPRLSDSKTVSDVPIPSTSAPQHQTQSVAVQNVTPPVIATAKMQPPSHDLPETIFARGPQATHSPSRALAIVPNQPQANSTPGSTSIPSPLQPFSQHAPPQVISASAASAGTAASQIPSLAAPMEASSTEAEFAALPLSVRPITEEGQKILTAKEWSQVDAIAEDFQNKAIQFQDEPAIANDRESWDELRNYNNDLLRARLGWGAFNALSLETRKALESELPTP